MIFLFGPSIPFLASVLMNLEPGLLFSPEKPYDRHPHLVANLSAPLPKTPSPPDWPLHALILNPSCLLATARLQTPFPSHFLRSHFALSAAILRPRSSLVAPSISFQSYGSLPSARDRAYNFHSG